MFTFWLAVIAGGVVLIGNVVRAADEAETPSDRERGPWAFQPLKHTTVPSLAEKQSTNPIDAFLLKELRERGLGFAPQVGRRELIRRVTFDLLGLPPTADEIREFESDESPDAYERLVDRLLANPRYGEHWGRYWLDIVRYAETAGFNADPVRPLAWKYRDWVIQALNHDLPYDQFVQQQIAGDELFPNDAQARIATGYILMWPDESNASNILLARQEALNDLTGNVGSVFLGVSIGCAQCHNHKFDPIPQRDFFRLQAFFSGLLRGDVAPVGSVEEIAQWNRQHDEWLVASQAPRIELQQLEAQGRIQAAGDRRMKFPAVVLEAVDTPPDLRTTMQRQLAFWCERQMGITDDGILAAMTSEQKQRRIELRQVLAEWEAKRPKPPATVEGMVAVEIDCQPPATHLLAAGSYNKPLDEVQPGFPSFVATGSTEDATIVSPHEKSSGRRTALAQWITNPANPLTSRVIVNRVWQGHFGRGLVENGNDFGNQTSPPSHPELLDWLASRFVSDAGQRSSDPDVGSHSEGLGWSLKSLHRLILLSSAYQQAGVSAVEPDMLSRGLEADVGNQWYWHFSRRRLTAESIRDSLLLTSGRLNPTLHGPSVWPELPKDYSAREAWKVSASAADRNRRSVYIHAKRNLAYPLLEAFDLPDMHESCARRTQTTVAPQALMLLNSDLVLTLARQLAGELLRANPEAESTELIRAGYWRVLGREADADELPAATSFLQRQSLLLGERAQRGENLLLPQGMPKFLDPARAAAVVDLCHVLLNANEFLFID